LEVTGSQSTTGTQGAATNLTSSLNKDQFLQLFIAELENQDPMEPMKTEQLTSQLAQLTIVEKLEHMANATDQLLDNSITNAFSGYSDWIGKTGFWVDSEGMEITGTIESIMLKDQLYYALIDGHEVPVTEIYQVSQEVDQTEPNP